MHERGEDFGIVLEGDEDLLALGRNPDSFGRHDDGFWLYVLDQSLRDSRKRVISKAINVGRRGSWMV